MYRHNCANRYAAGFWSVLIFGFRHEAPSLHAGAPGGSGFVDPGYGGHETMRVSRSFGGNPGPM